MSYTVEACIAYRGTLPELKSSVEQILGVQLCDRAQGHPAFCGRLLGMDVSLDENDLVTDGEINFSDFQFILGTRTGTGYVFNEYTRPLQLPIVELASVMICYHLNVEVMVTIDVQRLYRRYKPDELRAQLNP